MPGDGPARHVDQSPANFWPLSWATISAQQYTLSSTDASIPIFKEPHAVVVGTVIEKIPEQDGDTHCWVRLDDNDKSRFAVEFIPELTGVQAPDVGVHGSFYGLFRYDAQHQWFEIHPCTEFVAG